MSGLNITAGGAGEILRIGPIRIRVLEDGSRTDNRIGAVEVTVPAGMAGPPQHLHLMHDETFLVTSGAVRFIVGDKEHDAHAGDYVVVPIGAPHTFANPFGEPAVFFNTFTPAFYVNYFRELGKLGAAGPLSPDQVTKVRDRYATTSC
jgi:mannose-6-phosphate isomerase-like protein (cupin superfamily)